MSSFIAPLVLAAALSSQQTHAGTVPAPDRTGHTPLTVTEAVRLARENSPALRARGLARDAATGAADQAGRWANPDLELSSEDIPADAGGISSAQNMIGISQTFPFPGKKRLAGEIGATGIQVAGHDYAASERELVLAVKTAFFRTLAAERRLAVTRELEALAGKLGDAAGKRVAAGAAGRQEVLRAEIELERARAAVAAAARVAETRRRELAALIGRPDAARGPLGGALRERGPAVSAEDVTVRAREEHPAIAAARARREQAGLAREQAVRESRPDFTLGAAAGRDGATDETIFELRASLPLPLWDRAHGRRREAEALAAIAGADVESAEIALARDADLAVFRLAAAGEQVDAFRDRILPRAEQALALAQEGFASGRFGFLEVVDTQRTTVEARLEYVDRLLELNEAIAELEALAGMDFTER